MSCCFRGGPPTHYVLTDYSSEHAKIRSSPCQVVPVNLRALGVSKLLVQPRRSGVGRRAPTVSLTSQKGVECADAPSDARLDPLQHPGSRESRPENGSLLKRRKLRTLDNFKGSGAQVLPGSEAYRNIKWSMYNIQTIVTIIYKI